MVEKRRLGAEAQGKMQPKSTALMSSSELLQRLGQ